MAGISEAALLDALRAALASTTDASVEGLSSREIRRALGVGDDKVRSLIQSMLDEGLVEVQRAQRKGIHQQMVWVPIYRLRRTNG